MRADRLVATLLVLQAKGRVTAAELAGTRRSGAALGFQQTVLSGAGVVAPVVFAASVSATSWPAAFGLAAVFPVAGWLVLGALREH